jgi:gamma-butyrobetaine dioxygenase
VSDLDGLLALFDGEPATAMYDEVVTEREHALQAALLARSAGADDATVAAALLHDVGRLLLVDMHAGDRAHERLGEHHLAQWFGPEVTAPVGLHVAAKRYLCATEPEYLDTLSAVSVRSLAVQGGPMGDDEVAAFRARDGWEAAVALRRWDDEAKVAGLTTPDVESYRPVLEAVCLP